MSSNTQFAVSIHILILADVDSGETLTSQRAALSVGTNAAFIRRISSKLAEAGFLKIQKGKYGGMTLAKPAREIVLYDVYQAVDNSRLLQFHASEPNDQCFVGRNILRALELSLVELSLQFRSGLKKLTLADVSGQLLRLAGKNSETENLIANIDA